MEATTIDYLPKLILNKPVRRYSLEEYLRKEAKSDEKHEFINGQIIKMPSSKFAHNEIAGNIFSELKIEVKKIEKKVRIVGSDQKIYLPKLNEIVYPDALAISNTPLFWDDNQSLLINPFLVVEVLSKSTQKYDKSSKYDKYKTLESFREYVLIKQDECYVEVRFQIEPGLWRETIWENINESITLQSIGINIPLKNIYENIEFAVK